jgi:hypothetical protein
MSPIDHLHQWEERIRFAGLQPAGNIETPNAQLQVEWFYMTFHKSDCAEYVQSGHKLCNEMLQTLAEDFQLIHETAPITKCFPTIVILPRTNLVLDSTGHLGLWTGGDSVCPLELVELSK